MKNLIYISFIIVFTTFSCCNNKVGSNQSNDKGNFTNDSLNGEKLLSNKEFILSINKTCGVNSDSCVIDKITKNYYNQFNNLKEGEITISQMENGIELKLNKRKTNQDKYSIKIIFVSYKNNKKVDSLVCYESNNNPNNFVATERLYYLNNNYLWTSDFIYDETIITAENWKKYKINHQTGKFKLIEELR